MVKISAQAPSRTMTPVQPAAARHDSVVGQGAASAQDQGERPAYTVAGCLAVAAGVLGLTATLLSGRREQGVSGSSLMLTPPRGYVGPRDINLKDDWADRQIRKLRADAAHQPVRPMQLAKDAPIKKSRFEVVCFAEHHGKDPLSVGKKLAEIWKPGDKVLLEGFPQGVPVRQRDFTQIYGVPKGISGEGWDEMVWIEQHKKSLEEFEALRRRLVAEAKSGASLTPAQERLKCRDVLTLHQAERVANAQRNAALVASIRQQKRLLKEAGAAKGPGGGKIMAVAGAAHIFDESVKPSCDKIFVTDDTLQYLHNKYQGQDRVRMEIVERCESILSDEL